ncbi:hypothetical protein [Hymenobacter cellulosilyticus]|uniref:Uncharacterized protein n=1 Tax=Hymenobacter cellulosilyticus TaxID=2932248 RepID=A0A8T9QCB1_9BACT|nr:hypothetical protein [Hymenobacter cellulosilyticus]UOQ74845.1 hypothetical protein MUN79_13820 [Hymenobacter cellulosilyticus]
MLKPFLFVLALASLLTSALAATAQSQPAAPSKSDATKAKTRQGGTVAKSKVAADGEVKHKNKVANGSKLKSKTKPAPAAGKIAAGVVVGGNLMMPDKDLVENALNSTDHTTLVSALRAGGLVETLKGPGR